MRCVEYAVLMRTGAKDVSAIAACCFAVSAGGGGEIVKL